MQINIGGSDFDENDALEEAYEDFGLNPVIKVFVEGFDDKRFWGKLLSEQGFSNFNIDAVGVDEKANGKGTLLALVNQGKITLGKYNLICVDSDYDNYYGLNQDILNNDFCFQTYAYSIENYYYHPQNLLELCCKISGNFSKENIPCFEQLVNNWSNEYYYSFLTLLENKKTSELKSLILNLRYTGVEPAKKESLPTELLDKAISKGILKDNLFLFYRGHNFEAQMRTLANRAIIYLNKQEIDKISTNHTGEKKKSLISMYRKSNLNLKTAVELRDIPSNDLYQRIISDITQFKTNYYT
ncbi:DUF4435 domain-containing protein [Aeromonas hydrophila]